MDVETEMIQPGWTVCTSDGHELGTVRTMDHGTIVIKEKGLLRSKELHIPRTAVSYVETGRVDLSISKKEAESHQSQ